MSYILDALRRADAERERGAVPGLHAQPVPPSSGESQRAAPGRSWVGPVAGAAALLVLVALAWQWFAPAPAPAPVAALPAPAAPAVAVQPPPAAPHAAPALDPIPQAPVAKEPERIPALKELPDELRRQLPALAIGGSMYSDDPARRMLIINGQLYHEHDTPAPGLTLEQIKLKAAVLRYQGQRFLINF